MRSRIISPDLRAPSRWVLLTACLLVAASSLVRAQQGADPAASVSTAVAGARGAGSTADHAKFEELDGTFDSIEAASEACLTCHNRALEQIGKTLHWTWHFQGADDEDPLGKRHLLNGFYGSVTSNVGGCTACHVGFDDGRDDPDFGAPERVDCLICHDRTGKYALERFHQDGASCPVCHDERVRKTDLDSEPVDLGEVARAVGASSRATCGACHFHADGGDGVKHGDLDSSLLAPPAALDVHMSPQGPDFSCTTCHRTAAHAVWGSRYAPRVHDPEGIDPTTGARATCESCHGAAPMKHAVLNRHTDRVACQTCHIPTFARGGVATRARWDWSTAGKRGRKGRVLTKKDEQDRVVYTTQKGSFEWAENVRPTYIWFNGDVRYTRPGMTLSADGLAAVNHFQGAPDDPDSRIYPVKVMRTNLPFDAERRTLFPFRLMGRDRDAYWTSYKWDRALASGAERAGLYFDGKAGFVETANLIPITHMVAPAEQALNCVQCHAPGGRLEAVKGVYIPGRDRNVLVDRIGFGLAALSILGVLLHGFVRLVFAAFRRRPAQ